MASNAPKAGGYDCKFVETPPDKLNCQICLLVAHIPYKVTCCRKVYCKACLEKYSSTCPNCRKTSFTKFYSTKRKWSSDSTLEYAFGWLWISSPIGEQEIKSLNVKCNNCENGCGWLGELRSLDNHLKTCGYALLRCPNECTKNKKVVQLLRHGLDTIISRKSVQIVSTYALTGIKLKNAVISSPPILTYLQSLRSPVPIVDVML